jgi:hypothetical protein
MTNSIYIWLLGLIFVTGWYSGQAQTTTGTPAAEPAPATVLVVGFPLSQFYSNVFYIDEIAYVNDTTVRNVIPLYNQAFKTALASYPAGRYRFVAADTAQAAHLHEVSTYVDWRNEFNEPYTALGSDSLLDLRMQALMEYYQADYLLSINFYEITRGSSPNYLSPQIRTQHIIHYEVFTPDLRIASAGTIPLITRDLRAGAMRDSYREFAQELRLRMEIFEAGYTPEVARRRYFRLRDRLVENNWGGGVFAGWNSAYGWLGAELTRYIGNRVDLNAGIGVGFSGFKAGAGMRYYLLEQGHRYKPFLGVRYAWASGMQMNMGGTTDASGVQINPGDVSTFRIPSARSVHLTTGFRWLFTDRALLLGAGYGIALGGRREAIIENPGDTVTPDVLDRRRRTANLFTVGGVDVSLTYIFFL